MTGRGARGREDPLEIHAGDHILEIAVLISVELSGIKGLKACRQDHGAYIQINVGFLLFKVDGSLFTEFLACFAFALFARINGLEVQTGFSVDRILQGHRLSEGDVNGLALVLTQIKLVRDFFGALLSTNTAPDAFVFINVPGNFQDFDLEISGVATDAFNFGKGDEVNVGVPADLDQLGRDNSHGTLVGRKGLIQLGHDPADARRPFHQVYVKT